MKGEKPLRAIKIKQRRYTVSCDGLDGMQVSYYFPLSCLLNIQSVC